MFFSIIIDDLFLTITMTAMADTMFPPQAPAYILNFQFSSWYPRFSSVSIKSTIIKPLPEDFADYMNEDSIFLPEGSEDMCVLIISVKISSHSPS